MKKFINLREIRKSERKKMDKKVLMFGFVLLVVSAILLMSLPGSLGSDITGYATDYSWETTYTVDESSLTLGYGADLANNERMKLIFDEDGYYVTYIGIVDLQSDYMNLDVSNDSQLYNMEVGQELKLNVTNKDYFDLYIKINPITGERANLFVKKIHESIPKNNTIYGTIVSEAVCVPQWTCSWSNCDKGIKKYSCADEKNCGSDSNKPQEINERCFYVRTWQTILLVVIVIVLAAILTFGSHFILKHRRHRTYYHRGYFRKTSHTIR
jgi:hypothetical protein